MWLLVAKEAAKPGTRDLVVVFGFVLAFVALGTELKPPATDRGKRAANIAGILSYFAAVALLAWGLWPNEGARTAIVLLGIAALIFGAFWAGHRLGRRPPRPPKPKPVKPEPTPDPRPSPGSGTARTVDLQTGDTVNYKRNVEEVAGPTPSSEDRITRRETIYDETGRAAGQEIVHESGRRDAIVTPETVPTSAQVPPTGRHEGYNEGGRTISQIGNDLLNLARRLERWLKEEVKSHPSGSLAQAEIPEHNRKMNTDMIQSFSQTFQAEVIRLYEEASSRGFIDSPMEAVYDHPHEFLDFNVIVKGTRAVAERMLRGGQT